MEGVPASPVVVVGVVVMGVVVLPGGRNDRVRNALVCFPFFVAPKRARPPRARARVLNVMSLNFSRLLLPYSSSYHNTTMRLRK